jgi:hypothetical protein
MAAANWSFGNLPIRKEMTMNRKTLLVAFAAAFLLTLAAESDAKRVGGGKTVGANKPSSVSKAKKPDETPANETAAQSRSMNITPRISTSSGSPAQPQRSAVPAAAVGAAAGVAAGTLAGTAAASADSDARKRQEEATRKRQQELAALQQRFDEEVKLRKAEDERMKAEAAAKAAEAARKKQEQREAQRLAALESEKKAKRERAERDAQCQIKPVMSDDEIAKCRVR